MPSPLPPPFCDSTMDPNHSFPSSSYSWLSGFPGAAAVPGANISFDLIPIDEDDDAAGVAPSRSGPAPRQEREPMFEKSLTPSDVGKLNRLVIPKQHAERHFPLGGGGGGGDKGLLLCFEDDGGKLWRFRYSYWSSSQSYVLTKGWSRFVKEKRLDAGDVVLFDRHRRDGSRLFIGWKRRAAAAAPDRRANPGARGGFYPAHPYPAHPQPYPHQPDPHYLHAGSAVAVQIPAAVAVPATGSPKRLRLFGVNMECQPGLGFGSDGSSGAGGPSHGGAHSQLYAHMYAADPSPSGGSFYTDMNFGPDVKMT